jgi:hypothetical protein
MSCLASKAACGQAAHEPNCILVKRWATWTRAWLLPLETCPDQLPGAARRGDVHALPAGIRIKNYTVSEVGTQAAVDIALAILRATVNPAERIGAANATEVKWLASGSWERNAVRSLPRAFRSLARALRVK